MSLVVVGAGPNLGLAIARRFGREGFAVGLISRTQSRLDELAAGLNDEGIAEVLWRHHTKRDRFQTRVGID